MPHITPEEIGEGIEKAMRHELKKKGFSDKEIEKILRQQGLTKGQIVEAIKDPEEFKKRLMKSRAATTPEGHAYLGLLAATGLITGTAAWSVFMGDVANFFNQYGWLAFFCGAVIVALFSGSGLATGLFALVGFLLFIQAGGLTNTLVVLEKSLFSHPLGAVLLILLFLFLLKLIRR